MPGNESGGVGNFWYSFDYGLAHFISIDGETDFPFSPEWPFLRDVEDKNETLPTKEQTFITDSGPFGAIKDDKITENEAYEQYQWLEKDLASIDRTKTPWVVAMSHRFVMEILLICARTNIVPDRCIVRKLPVINLISGKQCLKTSSSDQYSPNPFPTTDTAHTPHSP